MSNNSEFSKEITQTSQTKEQKPPMMQRNYVVWVAWNKKFIREHSQDFPKPSWVATHTKGYIIWMLLYFIAMTSAFFVKNMHYRIILICSAVVIFTVYIVDEIIANIRFSRFIGRLLDAGGVIVDPWNERIINRNSRLVNLVAAVVIIVFYVTVSLILYRSIIGSADIGVALMVIPMNLVNFGNIYKSLNYYGEFGPYMFMDIDEGMLFGGALLSYDILSGIKPTETRNGFELYYENEKVAAGRMLPDDMNHLLSILDIRSRYY